MLIGRHAVWVVDSSRQSTRSAVEVASGNQLQTSVAKGSEMKSHQQKARQQKGRSQKRQRRSYSESQLVVARGLQQIKEGLERRRKSCQVLLAKRARKSTKFSTCVQRSTCVSFGHPLALTCDDFGRVQIPMQVDASFSPFGHPTEVDTS